jgi:hypothetical protein
MPTYAYQCQKCGGGFEAFSKSFRKENIGDIVVDVACTECQTANAKRVWPDELDNQIVIGEFKDSQDKRSDDNKKRFKDPDRAMKKRKTEFGSDNVNVGKSQFANREHKIQKKIIPQDQGTSQDIDKTEFIKMAAKNPNALAAAEKALKHKT